MTKRAAENIGRPSRRSAGTGLDRRPPAPTTPPTCSEVHCPTIAAARRPSTILAGGIDGRSAPNLWRRFVGVSHRLFVWGFVKIGVAVRRRRILECAFRKYRGIAGHHFLPRPSVPADMDEIGYAEDPDRPGIFVPAKTDEMQRHRTTPYRHKARGGDPDVQDIGRLSHPRRYRRRTQQIAERTQANSVSAMIGAFGRA